MATLVDFRVDVGKPHRPQQGTSAQVRVSSVSRILVEMLDPSGVASSTVH